MAYTDYNAFRSSVVLMIDGDEIPSTLSPATIDLMVTLGEALVYYGDESGLPPLRASSMQADLSETAADNAVAIPDDCLELAIVWIDPDKPLQCVPEEDLRRGQRSGQVRKYAQAGDSIIFSPAVEDGTEVAGRYFAKPAPIKDGLHATFNRYPELYLYAALYASAPFLGFDKRIPVWQNYYRSLLKQAQTTERNRAYSGSRLRQVAR